MHDNTDWHTYTARQTCTQPIHTVCVEYYTFGRLSSTVRDISMRAGCLIFALAA